MHITSDSDKPVELWAPQWGGGAKWVCDQPCDQPVPRNRPYQIFGDGITASWQFDLPSARDVTLRVTSRPMKRRYLGVLLTVLGGVTTFAAEPYFIFFARSPEAIAAAVPAILVGLSTTIWGLVIAAKRSRVDVAGLPVGSARLTPQGIVF